MSSPGHYLLTISTTAALIQQSDDDWIKSTTCFLGIYLGSTLISVSSMRPRPQNKLPRLSDRPANSLKLCSGLPSDTTRCIFLLRVRPCCFTRAGTPFTPVNDSSMDQLSFLCIPLRMYARTAACCIRRELLPNWCSSTILRCASHSLNASPSTARHHSLNSDMQN
ncbi:hypothetical protein BV25DRAFT_1466754 [Artomyces pyxidatus]|uniref:Uncharacterized protein n=1 Tax=Artomyces pyxidatus TaxID=48021 RepID=A0ACB8SMD5_9AGAM|nr:hypothetical protein BV25DRAFT_1466754 [Artomyces pyxidatus]